MQPYPPGFRALPPMGSSAALFRGGPQNQPGTFECEADRIVPAGGALASHLLHPDVVPFQRVYRKLPSPGLYVATRNKPYQAIMGAFTVPPELTLALQGAVIRPYRFDSLAPGDAVPLERRRLSLSLAYDLNFSNMARKGNISAELIPAPDDQANNVAFPNLPSQGTGFAPLPTVSPNGGSSVPALTTAYTVAAGQGTPNGAPAQATPVSPGQYVITASAGGALLPQTQDPKQGPVDMPFTYLVEEGTSVTLWLAAFAPVRIPLAFVEAELTGYLIAKQSLTALLQRMRPCA